MTVKELFSNVEFEQLFPYLKKREQSRPDRIYLYRQAYDRLRDMEPDKDFVEDVYVLTDDDEEKYTEIQFPDDNFWEKELAKTFVFPEGIQVSMEELAAICLWDITYYGFPPRQRQKKLGDMFSAPKPTNRYKVALEKLRESIWKHQVPRKFRRRGDNGERLTNDSYYTPRVKRMIMNRSKKKRKYRQDKRYKELIGLIGRESVILELTLPGSSLTRRDVDYLLHIAPGNRFDYESVVQGTDGRLDYILESMTRYQTLDLEPYDNAVVFVNYSKQHPINEHERNTFVKAVNDHLGYTDIRWGYMENESDNPEIQVMLLLNWK